MLKLVVDHPDRRNGRLGRFFAGVAKRMKAAFLRAFPPPDLPNPPGPNPPLAKHAALREGALLAEDVDAVSRKTVA